MKSGMPPEIQRYILGWKDIQLDGRVVAFTLVAAVLSGILAGLAPAWQCSRPNLTDALKEGGRGGSAGGARHRLRNILVAAEIALAVVLLGGAGLHVTEVARLLEIRRVVVPSVAAVLSAWGMLATDLRYELVRSHVCDACGGDGKIAVEPCSECGGRGRVARRRTLQVDIPAGIADEQRIRLTGRGHAGERGGRPGDLYVLVRVAPDERFVRDGNDLVSVIDLPAPQAALGARVSVPTLDGEEEVEIEAGTQPGTVITLRGKGMPSLRRGRRGDQRVVVNVMIPRKLSAEQRDLLERFSATLGEENLREDGSDESLFARVRRALS